MLIYGVTMSCMVVGRARHSPWRSRVILALGMKMDTYLVMNLDVFPVCSSTGGSDPQTTML